MQDPGPGKMVPTPDVFTFQNADTHLPRTETHLVESEPEGPRKAAFSESRRKEAFFQSDDA